MRRIEAEYQIRTQLLPRVKSATDRLTLLDRLTFHARLTSLPKDQYDGASTSMLKQLPTLRTKIELMSIMGFNPSRKGGMHDFFDIEIMIAPLAHANAFAAEDKWITHLLTKETTLLQENDVQYLSSASALLDYL
jgi:hypothetical protein